MDTLKENLLKKIGEAKFRKIQRANIGIAGAGGLGSNCALNLVRVGFKKITIVDFDKISASNLDRQFYFLDQVGMSKVEALKNNLLRINPELEIIAVNQKLDKANIKKIFSGCSIVVECLDQPDNKSMLVAQLLALKKFVVAASGLGGIGSSDEIKIRKLKTNLVMVGDLHSDIIKKPALSPRVNVAAAKQADIVLDFVVNSS